MRRPRLRLEGRKLALEAQHRGADQGSALAHAGIRDGVARDEIVRRVADQVVAGYEPAGVAAIEAQRVRLDPDQRVQRRERGGEACHLGLADAVGPVRHLTLQIGQLDRVVVDEPDRADARRRQIQRQRAAEPAGADHQHAGRAQPRLSDAADLGQQDVPRVALDFSLGELHAKPHGDRAGPRKARRRSRLALARRASIRQRQAAFERGRVVKVKGRGRQGDG